MFKKLMIAATALTPSFAEAEPAQWDIYTYGPCDFAAAHPELADDVAKFPTMEMHQKTGIPSRGTEYMRKAEDVYMTLLDEKLTDPDFSYALYYFVKRDFPGLGLDTAKKQEFKYRKGDDQNCEPELLSSLQYKGLIL